MIKSLEGLRGIAALIVALYHLRLGADYFSVIRNGYLLVDLFFVLSGFVICASYSSSMKSMSDFMVFIIRRFGRLFPLLVFSTMFYVLDVNLIVLAKKIAADSGHAGLLNNPGALQYMVPSMAEIGAVLSFTHALGIFDHLILNTPTWSISTEFYTYLLFAGIFLLFRGKPKIALVTLTSIFGLIVSVWVSVNIHHCVTENGCLSLTYDFGFARCIYSFFLGVLAYYTSRQLQFNAVSLQLTMVFALVVLFTVIDFVAVAAFVFPVAFAVLVVSLSRDTGPLADSLKQSFFQELGKRSYSIYLLHVPFLLFFENIAKRAHGMLLETLVVLGYVTVLYVFSEWTYRFIENPARRYFYRLTSAGRASTYPEVQT